MLEKDRLKNLTTVFADCAALVLAADVPGTVTGCDY